MNWRNYFLDLRFTQLCDFHLQLSLAFFEDGNFGLRVAQIVYQALVLRLVFLELSFKLFNSLAVFLDLEDVSV